MSDQDTTLDRSSVVPQVTMQETDNQAAGSDNEAAGSGLGQADSPLTNANSPRQPQEVVKEYLFERCEEFRRLHALQLKGWENKHFREQRRKSDEVDAKDELGYFQKMLRIGEELHEATGAFTIAPLSGTWSVPRILDLCMATGGFLQTALSKNLGDRAVAFTLPSSQGGHSVFLRDERKSIPSASINLPDISNVSIKFADITMFAADMGVSDLEIPVDRESRKWPAFAASRMPVCKPAHSTLSCATVWIITRTSVQGMTRSQEVGSWNNVQLLYLLSSFATVRVYKPTTAHTFRGSFYLVASNVRSDSAEARRAVAMWKEVWRVAMGGFRTEEEDQEAHPIGEHDVEQVLKDFGEELVELGKPVWEVQATALAKAPFMENSRPVVGGAATDGQ
ncbi:Uu.00g031810.m01.CDS01 [Anthostomella pinea]|uniref:Uu.00g031810.m01.CDS01 n=1 Tax=Anthostomella pinea TaxID=933095 RepID=A0AAI8YD89_9PEZI|nr:Uu.00g031810.m01.CDS01 [Anthostomella pinea]